MPSYIPITDDERRRWALKSQTPYTQDDALRDHASANTGALREAAYRIADGAAAKIAKRYPTWHPGPDWFAEARAIGVECASGWTPQTLYRGLPVTFAKFICKRVDSWYEAQRYQYNKAKRDPEASNNTEAPLEEYVLVEEDTSVAEHHSGVTGDAFTERAIRGAIGNRIAPLTIDPRLDPQHADGERLDPKDDGERGGRIERQIRPVTSRYRAPPPDPCVDPLLLEAFLAADPESRKRSLRLVCSVEPYTKVSIKQYAKDQRQKSKGYTDEDRARFEQEVRDAQILLSLFVALVAPQYGLPSGAARVWDPNTPILLPRELYDRIAVWIEKTKEYAERTGEPYDKPEEAPAILRIWFPERYALISAAAKGDPGAQKMVTFLKSTAVSLVRVRGRFFKRGEG